jgi:hypothetical protein
LSTDGFQSAHHLHVARWLIVTQADETWMAQIAISRAFRIGDFDNDPGPNPFGATRDSGGGVDKWRGVASESSQLACNPCEKLFAEPGRGHYNEACPLEFAEQQRGKRSLFLCRGPPTADHKLSRPVHLVLIRESVRRDT